MNKTKIKLIIIGIVVILVGGSFALSDSSELFQGSIRNIPPKTSDQKATTKKKVTPAKKTEKTKKTEKKVTRPQGAKKEEPQKVMRGVAEEVKKEEKSQPPEEKSENKTVQEAAVQTTLPSKEEEHFTASVETGKQILQLLDTIVTATKVPPSCPVVYVYTREQTPQQPVQQATENTQTTQQAPQAPAPSILNDLVVYYDFEVENNGLLTDMSGTGNQGRILGAQMTEGKKGRGLSFDGDDYVLLDKGRNLDITDTITIASWLKFEGTSGDARFVYKRSGNNGVFLQSPKNAADRIEFGFGDSAGNMFGAVSKKAYNDGLWHHVAGTYDGVSIKLYVDGVLETETPLRDAAIYYQTPISAIGRNANEGGRFWTGGIDEFRIYHRALTPEEVRSLVNL